MEKKIRKNRKKEDNIEKNRKEEEKIYGFYYKTKKTS